MIDSKNFSLFLYSISFLLCLIFKNFTYNFYLSFGYFFIPLVIQGFCKSFLFVYFVYENTDRIKQYACVKTNWMYHSDFYYLWLMTSSQLVLYTCKKKLSNTLRLNFSYLNVIHFLYAYYQSKLIWDILKNMQKTSVFVLMWLYLNFNENKGDNAK